MDAEFDPIVPARLSTVGEVRRALHPLQAQADRVGRQVEEFAETLDQLSSTRGERNGGCAQVLPLVQQYERIAGDTVKRLKRRHSDEKKKLLRENRRRKLDHGSDSTALALYDGGDREEADSTATTVQDLLHWEQERQTWELLGLMLQVHYPQDPDDEQEQTNLERPKDSRISPYSSNYAVYRKYLANENSAWERHVILEWLARSADESREDLEDVVAEATKDDQGLTRTTNGWIHTKEAIKGEKRLLSWPLAIEPEQISASRSLVNADKKPVVTQMDPDAFTRQGRTLKTEDLASERATWLGCWELLRRGRPWDEIEDWCKQHQEGWLAISMRGDPRLGRSMDFAPGTLAGRAQWQQACLQLAKNGGTDVYEKAVFGLLGGDEHSIFKVCRTWDDFLHAWLSCQLSQKFSFYFCEEFGLEPTLSPPDATSIVRQSLTSFIDGLSTQKSTAEEALTPFKALQSNLIKNSPAKHLRNQGLRISEQLQGAQYAFLSMKASQQSTERQDGPTSPISLDDHSLVRILTHVLLIYLHIEPKLNTSPAMENLIVAYVDFLGRAGKQQLLPLYASYLAGDRAAKCLARQLPFIKDTTERQVIVRLMKRYGMEDEIVLLAQLDSIISASPAAPEYRHDFPPLELLDPRGPDYKDIRPLKREVAGYDIQEWEEDLIDSLEWFLLLEGDAKFTIYPAGIVVYKHLIRTRSYAAVKKLAATINSGRISQVVPIPGQVNGQVATETNMDTDADVMQTDEQNQEQKELKAQNDRDNDLADVKIFQDLENFAIVLEAMDNWEQVIHAGTGARVQAHEGDKSALKVWKKRLQAVHNIVMENMQPLLQGWLLPTKGKTEDEMKELHRIRVCMLPELVLAYLSVLSFAGTWLNRENLLECMNLAKQIADEDKDLCQVFVDAGRMADLMTTMANVSRQILAAQENTGAMKMKKRRGGGELLDIWSVDAEKEG